MHIPLLAELVDLREMGSQARLKQCTQGFPMKGGLAEPGVYPTANAEAPELSREELMEEAKDRAAPL